MSNNRILGAGAIPAAEAAREHGATAAAPAFSTVKQAARRTAVRPLFGAASPQPELEGAGFTYRHDWGPLRGQLILQLDWTAINPRSRVFVSIGEGAAGGPDAGKFIGSARYTVHNIAPRAGGVDVWVNVEWEADIPLYADYLVVNPADVTLRTVQVSVHRHSTVPLSEADADRILGDMGTVLQSADSAADTATNVQFVRNGPVQVLPDTIAGTIQTEAELVALLDAGAGVKVVEAIRWCGGPGGSIIGCAPVGSPTVNVAVVRFSADQEGILWAHEYGHNAGLGHRTDDARAIMYPSIGPDHNVVDAAEAERYLSGPLAVSGTLMASACAMGASVGRPQDVRDFVSHHWIEGVPYQVASQYTEADARQLLAWLADAQQHEEFLPEIVTTLCFIGSEVAVEPLLDFVRGPLASRAAFHAKNAALIHLGDLVNKCGSQAAFDFLAGIAADRDAARTLAAPRAASAVADALAANVSAPTLEALGSELAVSATFGLALTGRANAETMLSGLVNDPAVFVSVKAAATEAVQIARTVRDQGQEAYYRSKCAG